MTPDELRDHAAAIMVDHARDVERMSIREHLEEQGIDPADAMDVQTIYDLIAKGTVSIDFPADGPSDPVLATYGVLAEVASERVRQNARWGEQNHPDGTGEGRWDKEAANRARALCQSLAARGELTWTAILSEEIAEAYAEFDPAKLRAELIQVAAVAAAWVEAIDRRQP